MKIVLASSSKYRIQQLNDFGLDFLAVRPLFDEEKLKNKGLKPKKLCARLAYEKAASLTLQHADDVIIGADQLVSFRNEILGKPGTKKNAVKMLKKMQGKSHLLVTSVCMLYKNKKATRTVVANIKMRKLSNKEISQYVSLDNPIDCAGSYKLEKAGLSLVESLRVSDPSSLTGLPLIALRDLFLELGVKPQFLKKL